MRFIALIISAVLVFASIAGPVAMGAQRPGNTVRGVITASAEMPQLVKVRLERLGETIESTVVQGNRFEFRDVPAGRYMLLAEAPGYDAAELEITVPGDWPTIELHPRGQSARPASAGSVASVASAASVVDVRDLKVPRSARRQFESARKELRRNNYAQALSHLRKAVHAYNDYGEAHATMALCYADMNQLDAAEEEFKHALDQPHAPELHLLLGNIYARQNNREMVPRQVELYTQEVGRSSKINRAASR